MKKKEGRREAKCNERMKDEMRGGWKEENTKAEKERVTPIRSLRK